MKQLSSCLVAASLAVATILCGCGGAASSTSSSSAQAEGMPAKFDLRDKGLVTSVKNQSPYGASWAYGALASAESSALLAEDTTYQEDPIDFSEEHLMQFALSPVSELDDSAQAGEGLYVAANTSNGYDESSESMLGGNASGNKAPQTIFDVEGSGRFADAVLASGCGPRLEGSYSAGDDASVLATGVASTSGRGTFEGYTLRDANVLPPVAKRGEPTPEAPNGVWEGRSEEGERAIKDELQKGHAVAVMVYAEDAVGGAGAAGGAGTAGGNINTQTWSQYTSDPAAVPNHSVCIVGWDDDYAKENFARSNDGSNASSSSANGSAAGSDDSVSSAAMPPQNGAWIVKDSRGSETDAVEGDKTSEEDGASSSSSSDGTSSSSSASSSSSSTKASDDGKWGIVDENGKHTGYYYVSYYDTSLDAAETLVLDNDFAKGDFDVMQHDYLCTADAWQATSNEGLSAANVFTAKHDGELRAVATRTPCNNATVEFTIRKVARRSTNPEEGPTLARFSQTFPYAGFHRVDLPQVADVKSGDYISVVTTTTTTGDDGAQTYCVTAARFNTLDAVEQESSTSGSRAGSSDKGLVYGKGVINAGESFVKRGDEWVDWLEYLASDEFAQDSRGESQSGTKGAESKDALGQENAGTQSGVSNMTYDNFCIKAYLVPTDGTGNIRNVRQDDVATSQDGYGGATSQDYGGGMAWQGNYGDLS